MSRGTNLARLPALHPATWFALARLWSKRHGVVFGTYHECTKGTVIIDHDYLEEFRDPQTYNLEDEGYYEEYPLTEQWARSLGGPLLDLACGTGRMALRMAAQGYQVTGVDIMPEMIEWASQKAARQAISRSSFPSLICWKMFFNSF